MNIKPIETHYNGYRFRSRLEARWAVFFDNMGVAYEYEPEGFQLPSGGYLPDFRLPELGVYVEIKPNCEMPLSEIRKIVEFSSDLGQKLLLIVGQPTDEQMFLCDRRSLPCWNELESSFNADANPDHEAQNSFLASVVIDGAVAFARLPLVPGWSLAYDSYGKKQLIAGELALSLASAKQARFEHGQTPKGPRG